MTVIRLHAPFAGWAGPLEELPDPVFAGRMMGDGLALDPFEGEVRAPCDGVIVAVAPTRHSVTLRAANGAEILIHVGLDTVTLGGDGFEELVASGERVVTGQPLLRFDLDIVVQGAASLMAPIVVMGEQFHVTVLASGRAVAAGEAIMEVVAADASTPVEHQVDANDHASCEIVVPLAHGLHARPAARIVATLKPFIADVRIEHGERSGDARSVVSLLGLGVTHGDRILILGDGADARAAIAAVATLIEGGMGETGVALPLAEPAIPVGPAPPSGAIIGTRASPGFAVGTAMLLRAIDLDVPETGRGAATERRHLDNAIAALIAEIARDATSGIAAAHIALLDDPELMNGARALIADGHSAAFAWRWTSRAHADAILATGDARLAERIADLRDIERRLIAHLLGVSPGPAIDLPPDAILLADELLPSQFLALDTVRLAGICTAKGGPTSHVAILAASAGIPMIVAAGDGVLVIADGADLILDADNGSLRLADSAGLAKARDQLGARCDLHARQQASAQDKCVMADGTRIEIFANCGSPDDAAQAVLRGAEGCGLLRTEFLFLDRGAAPSEQEQADTYAAVATALGGRPLIVRTLDIGGDKPVAYLRLPVEENPALGVRGIRVSLANPAMLAEQFRAILRGVPAAQCRIMLPMIVDVLDYRAARAILQTAAADLGVAVPPLGIMVETPAAALLSHSLAAEADFLSIGSNDLTQYTLAADRGNPALAPMIDALHPAVLRLIALAAEGAGTHGRWLGVCGGIASDPQAAAVLIGLGATELSAAPAAVPTLKAAIRTLNREHCRTLALQALAAGTAAEVRQLIEESR